MLIPILVLETSLGFLAVLPLVIIYHIVILRKARATRAVIPHVIAVYVYCFYMLAVLTVTGVPSLPSIGLDVRVNLVPFNDISIIPYQYIQNMLLFIPFGFLSPMLWRRFQKLSVTFINGLLLSLAIEISQLFCYRATDIDDLLMNTLGAVAGYFLFMLAKVIFPRIASFFNDNDATHFRREVYYCTAFAWLVVFLVQPYISNMVWRFFH